MPTISEIFGPRFFFYSDEHRPIHVYVVKGDDDAKIQIEDEAKLVYNHGLKAKDLKRVLELAGTYEEDIIDIWNEYHQMSIITETIKNIWFEKGRIYILSNEDKVYSRPLEVFPLLKDAAERQRMDYTTELHGEALRWTESDEDIHILSFYIEDEPKYGNEIVMLFRRFSQLNVSEVARNLGANKSLLSKYIYGIKDSSVERACQIRSVLCALGRELAAA